MSVLKYYPQFADMTLGQDVRDPVDDERCRLLLAGQYIAYKGNRQNLAENVRVNANGSNTAETGMILVSTLWKWRPTGWCSRDNVSSTRLLLMDCFSDMNFISPGQ